MDQDSVTILLPNEQWNNRSILKTRDRKPIILFAFQTLLLFAHTIFTLSFDFFINTKADHSKNSVSRSSTVVYFSHLAICLLCTVFKIYLDKYYHRKLKLYGYHKHHSNTTYLTDAIHLLLNKTTLLLLLNSAIYQVMSTDSNDVIKIFGFTITQTQLAKTITSVISSIMTIVSANKLHIEIDFQRQNSPPDTICDNDINETRQSSNDIGIRLSNLTDELLEKQYEMIVNLKQQNERLVVLLVKAQEENDAINSTNRQ